MRPEEAAAMAVAARQDRVVSLEQCVAAGMSPRQVEHRLRTGRWRRLHRGVYLVGPGEPGELATYHAAVLAIGEDGALSHRSAAALWALRDRPVGPPEVVSTTKRRPGERLRSHWTRDLPRRDVTVRRGVRTTALGRTLLDLADVAAADEMELALRAADRIHGFGRERLRPVNGRRGTRTLRLGHELTRGHLERLFLRVVLEGGLSRPEMNVPWGPYEIDALWRAARVAVEIDDFDTHRTRDAFDADRVRDRVLTIGGLTPVRITHRDLTDFRERTLGHLRALGVR